MTTAISPFAPPAGALALDAESYARSLQLAAGSHQSSRTPILRLARDGSWIYGAENVEVEDEALVVVNPYTIRHGFQVWEDGALVEEQWVSVAQAAPVPSAPKANSGYQFDMQIATGADKGTDLLYSPTSVGGRDAAGKLLGLLSQQVASGGHVVPLIRLHTGSYNHRQYGKIYTPDLQVVEWLAADAQEVPDDPEEAPKRRRRGAA